MSDKGPQNEAAELVRWTYSGDEWRNFIRWKQRRKGFLHYLLHRLSASHWPQAPEITIGQGRVSIGNDQESFFNENRQLKRVNIHDAGKVNVLEIAYQRNDLQHTGPAEILIPVPKGKLKEAIQLQEKLSAGL